MSENTRLELLTSREPAGVLKINHQVVDRMPKRGELPGFKVGRYWRYRKSDLAAWVESRLESSRQSFARVNSF